MLFRTVSDKKLGGALERGYCKHFGEVASKFVKNFAAATSYRFSMKNQLALSDMYCSQNSHLTSVIDHNCKLKCNYFQHEPAFTECDSDFTCFGL